MAQVAQLTGTHRHTGLRGRALSERGREGRGPLARGWAGALQAPLLEVLCGVAWPLRRRQVRHVIRAPGLLGPEMVPVDHCGPPTGSAAMTGES